MSCDSLTTRAACQGTRQLARPVWFNLAKACMQQHALADAVRLLLARLVAHWPAGASCLLHTKLATAQKLPAGQLRKHTQAAISCKC